MSATRALFVTVSIGLVLLLSLAGCAAEDRSAAPAAQPAGPAHASATPKAEKHATRAPAADAEAPAEAEKPVADADKAEKDAKAKAKEQRERERKLARAERELDIARMQLEKTNRSNAYAKIRFDQSKAKLQSDLDLAERRMRVFKEVEIPNRTARSELSLSWAENNLQNAQEELDQLLLMYKDEQFADQTKEIVIDRSRRELERTKRDVELRRGEHETLVSETLPREQLERELALRELHRQLGQDRT